MEKIIFAFLILFSSVISAQNIKVEGFVKDSVNSPLENANVMAVNKLTKAMDAYNLTSDKGKFSLSLKPNTEYTIKVSYLGFSKYEKQIKTTAQNMTFDVVMKADNVIETVEIVKEMPVRISGDTIIYNSDSFTNGTERKLEDVLKKLPGVEVNKDGEIEVEGKKVQKVMVEGKDFFDGDTKIATKNIPADALDKIQVLRNYNEVSNLKGLENNEENIALNIKLKDGKKNFWFGDMLSGAGVGDTEDRYILNPKLFYYSPKYSINLIGNLNNIGELPLTMQDYFKFTGGFKNIMKKGGSNINISTNDLGIMGMRNNRAQNIDAKFGAANFSFNPSKTWSINGFGIYSYNKTNLLTENIYNRTDRVGNSSVQVIENRTDQAKQRTDLGLFKLSSSYIPSTKVHFDYDVLLKTSNQLENQSTYSNLQGDIFTEKKQKPVSVSQNLNYYYTLNEKHVFAIEAQNLFQQEDPFYNANLSKFLSNGAPILTPPFANLNGYNLAQNRYDGNQLKFVKTNKTDVKIDYYYMLTPKSNINLTLGNTYSYQNFDSSIFQVLDNRTTNNLTNSEDINNVNYQFNDAFASLHFKLLLGKFIFNPGVSFHQFNTKDDQNGSSYKMNFNRILPDFYVLWQIKKSQSLTYTYNMSNSFTDINRLAEGKVFNNYSSLFRGNRFLENSISHVHSLRFFKYTMFNMENIVANVNYTRLSDIITNRAELIGVNQVGSAINMNSNFPNETLTGFAMYGRSFLRYFKGDINARLGWNKNNNIRVQSGNEFVQTTESFTQNYGVSFSTNFKNAPNIELNYDFTLNDFQDQIFYVDNPSVNIEWQIADPLSFKSEYSFFHNRNKEKTVNTEYDFLSASLAFRKKDSKFEYTINATNILNTTTINDSSFNSLGGSSTFTSYYIQPRYITLSIKYNL